MRRRSSRACWPAGCGCWSGPTRRGPGTGARHGRTTTRPTARCSPAPIWAAPTRPRRHVGGSCLPALSGRSTTTSSRARSPTRAGAGGIRPSSTDPETGGLHNEALSGVLGTGSGWVIASRGWVQESWPRAMKEACPELALPAGLPVNGRQTSTAFGTMMAQDPAAPVRDAPGSHLRGPGATGIAAARGGPRLARRGPRPLPGRERRLRADRHRRRPPRAGAGRSGRRALAARRGRRRRRYRAPGVVLGRGGDRGALRPPADAAALPDRRRPPLPAHGRALRGDADHRPAGGRGDAGGDSLPGPVPRPWCGSARTER